MWQPTTTRLRMISILICYIIAVPSAGLAQNQNATEQKAIYRAKTALVSQLEPGMPKVTLEYYLQTEAGTGAKIAWEMNDCGEQTGNPADRLNDVPTCAEADVKLPDGATLTVMISVGSEKTGVKGKPKLVYLSISSKGSTRPLSRLSQIPIELHSNSGS